MEKAPKLPDRFSQDPDCCFRMVLSLDRLLGKHYTASDPSGFNVASSYTGRSGVYVVLGPIYMV